MDIRIFTDFDGTITRQDTLVYLLDRYAGKTWYEIEDRVDAGTLSEEEGLRAEIALLTAPWEEAIAGVLADVPADAGFAPFSAWCRSERLPLTILSGGLAPVIRAVLEREGLGDMPFAANDLEFDPDGRWRVVPADTPRVRALCNHCKSWHLAGVRQRGCRTVYIGDGTTDRCPSTHADLVFAKGGLARWCDEQGVAYRPFEEFAEIQAWLAGDEGRAWRSGAEPAS